MSGWPLVWMSFSSVLVFVWGGGVGAGVMLKFITVLGLDGLPCTCGIVAF